MPKPFYKDINLGNDLRHLHNLSLRKLLVAGGGYDGIILGGYLTIFTFSYSTCLKLNAYKST